MRFGLIGVSHWHAPHYYRAAAQLPWVQLVGVSDPDAAARERVAGELGVPGYADFRTLLDEGKPDFVFVFAPHHELATVAAYVIESRTACLIEKPAGMNQREVAGLRDRALQLGVHAGTGFNFRISDFVQQALRLIDDDEVTMASFRFIAGGPSRYRQSGCSWMLDPALSGGGSTINLGVHFFDLFRLLTRSEISDVTAMMGNHSWGLPVEDYSSVLLRSPRAVCTVETGYAFPAGATPWDLLFCVRTHRHYLAVRSDNVIELHRNADGAVTRIPTASAGNSYWYAAFAQQSLERCARGDGPIAGLADLASAMAIVDAAYASDRGGGVISPLH